MPMKTLASFLRCFSGLESLQVNDLSYDSGDFDWSSLLGHSASLKRLELEQENSDLSTGVDNRRHVLDPFDLFVLVEQCKELKELSLRLPWISLVDLLSHNRVPFGQYIVSTSTACLPHSSVQSDGGL